MPVCNTAAMNHHLSEISSQVAGDAHAVVFLDRAGWHRSQGLVIPANVTLLQLPPYSPELNPGERIWHYLRSHWLANTVFISLADVMDACEMAWNRFATNHRLIRSLARSPGLQLRPFTRSHLFGGPLARLEAQIAVGEFARRAQNPRLVVDPPPYRHNQIFRGPRHVLVDIDGVRD